MVDWCDIDTAAAAIYSKRAFASLSKYINTLKT